MQVYINNDTKLKEFKNYRGFKKLEKTDLHDFSFDFENDQGDTWYSYDPNSCNFHIVKDTEEIETNAKDTIRGLYQKELVKTFPNDFNISHRLSRGRAPWIKNHRWIEVRRHGFCYLLCLQTLCLNGNRISGDFNKIQFQAFPGYSKGCNYLVSNGKKREPELIVNYHSLDSTELKMDQEKEIYVKNTAYVVGDVSNITDVIGDFKNFIKEVENLTIKAIEKGNF